MRPCTAGDTRYSGPTPLRQSNKQSPWLLQPLFAAAKGCSPPPYCSQSPNSQPAVRESKCTQLRSPSGRSPASCFLHNLFNRTDNFCFVTKIQPPRFRSIDSSTCVIQLDGTWTLNCFIETQAGCSWIQAVRDSNRSSWRSVSFVLSSLSIWSMLPYNSTTTFTTTFLTHYNFY